MILLDKTHNNHTYKEFEAKIKILQTNCKNNHLYVQEGSKIVLDL